MIFRVIKGGVATPDSKISLRCPGCRQQATLEQYNNVNDVLSGGQPQVLLGQRRCPNPECHAHIFFASTNGKVRVSYPSEKIDFDSTNIPTAIVQALEEAITCHATQCFIAAAIMVRKTLEELCRERGATGKNLKDRIKALGSKAILPQELLDGLDDLRLLGNDAAHIESQEFDNVGKEEVEIGIELAKEVLKSVFQYADLLNRLRSLKK